MLSIGQVVYSKCGRDKGTVFLVVAGEGEFVFLADGRIRKLSKPKKKKLKHIQPTNTVLADVQQAITSQTNLLDADVRKALLPFRSAVCNGNKGVDDLV